MASPTVAEVLADVLVGAGAGRVFAAAGRATRALEDAAARRGIPPVVLDDPVGAAVMAAATGALADAPGVVVVADPGAVVPSAACAAASASALVAVTPPGPAPSLDPSSRRPSSPGPPASGPRTRCASR